MTSLSILLLAFSILGLSLNLVFAKNKCTQLIMQNGYSDKLGADRIISVETVPTRAACAVSCIQRVGRTVIIYTEDRYCQLVFGEPTAWITSVGARYYIVNNGACGPCSGGKLSTESKRGKCRCQVDPCTRKTCSSGSTCELKQKIRGGKTVKYLAKCVSSGACGPCSGGKLSTESKRGKCRCQVDPCTRKTCSSGSTCELKQKIRGGKTVKYLAKCVSSGSGSQPCSCTGGRLPIEKRNGKCGCRASPCRGNSCSAPNKCMAVTKKKGNRVFGYSAKCIHAHCKEPHPVGKCRAIFERFFFNIATQSCESFVYNGCSASQINMFSSATECTNYCKIKNTG